MATKVTSAAVQVSLPKEEVKETKKTAAPIASAQSTISSVKHPEIEKNQEIRKTFIAEGKEKIKDLEKIQQDEKVQQKDGQPPRKTLGQRIKDIFNACIKCFKKCFAKCFPFLFKNEKTEKPVNVTAELQVQLKTSSNDEFVALANTKLDEHSNRFDANDRIYMRHLLSSKTQKGAAKSEEQIKKDFASFIKEFDKGFAPVSSQPQKTVEAQKTVEEIEMTALRGTATGKGEKAPVKDDLAKKETVTKEMKAPVMSVPTLGPDKFPAAKNTSVFNAIRNEDL